MSQKDLNELKELVKKVADHDLKLDDILKRLKSCETESSRLDKEKADKSTIIKELQQLSEWCSRLEEMIKKLMGGHE